MTSELRVENLKGSTTGGSINVLGEGTSATTNLQQGLEKVWVNFDGTASGAASRDSFNVSGMTDNATGSYTPTFNVNMSNINYSCADSVGDHDGTSESFSDGYCCTQATSSMKIIVGDFSNGNLSDRSNVSVQICGDLA